MRRLSLPALALCLMAGSAQAAVTAEDIWRDWQASLAAFGYQVTGTPQRSAGGIVIPDLGLTQDIPEGGRVEMRMGRIELAERGDGSVAMIYPETMPIAIAVAPEEGEPVTLIVTLAQSGLAIIASGTPEALRYVYSANELNLSLGEVTIDGEAQEGLEGEIHLSEMAGTSMTQPEGAGRQLRHDFTSGPVSYALRFVPTGESVGFDYAGRTESMTYESRMHLPDDMDIAQMGAALNTGFEIEGRADLGAGEGRYMFIEEGGNTLVTSRNAHSNLEFALSAEGVSYGGEALRMQTEISLPGMPVPLAYEVARMAGRLTMPLTPSEAMRDFGLLLEMTGVTLGDAIWALFDPAATLPREAIELVLDLSGKGRFTVDLFDPAMMDKLEHSDQPPGEIARLDLNRLRISAAGARLTGSGGVDIDQGEGMEIPPAEGAFDFRLEGGAALLERLVAMGIVSQEQARMVQMMAGMFAQPVEGEDTLTSRVEVKKDGTLLVNGQKMR